MLNWKVFSLIFFLLCFISCVTFFWDTHLSCWLHAVTIVLSLSFKMADLTSNKKSAPFTEFSISFLSLSLSPPPNLSHFPNSLSLSHSFAHSISKFLSSPRRTRSILAIFWSNFIHLFDFLPSGVNVTIIFDSHRANQLPDLQFELSVRKNRISYRWDEEENFFYANVTLRSAQILHYKFK